MDDYFDRERDRASDNSMNYKLTTSDPTISYKSYKQRSDFGECFGPGTYGLPRHTWSVFRNGGVMFGNSLSVPGTLLVLGNHGHAPNHVLFILP